MSMERAITLAATLLVSAALLMTAWSVLNNPVDARRTEFAARLGGIEPESSAEEIAPWSYAQFAWEIQRKPKVWDGLVPPPPPPPKKPPAPKRPDLAKMLQGVVPLKGQVGDKVKMQLPGEKRPVWVSRGQAINGCVFKHFEDGFVIFSYNWKEGKQLLNHKIPRQ